MPPTVAVRRVSRASALFSARRRSRGRSRCEGLDSGDGWCYRNTAATRPRSATLLALTGGAELASPLCSEPSQSSALASRASPLNAHLPARNRYRPARTPRVARGPLGPRSRRRSGDHLNWGRCSVTLAFTVRQGLRYGGGTSPEHSAPCRNGVRGRAPQAVATPRQGTGATVEISRSVAPSALLG
jgi:hypothetical protein